MNLIDIHSVIRDVDKMFAHTSNYKPKELLSEHLDLVMDKVKIMDEQHKIFYKINYILKDILKDIRYTGDINKTVDFLINSICNSIYLHDVGKCSVGFQVEKMDNIEFKAYYEDNMVTNHSLFSSRITLDLLFVELQKNINSFDFKNKEKEFYFLIYLLIGFVYNLQKHHAGLDSVKEFINNVDLILCDNDGNYIKAEAIKELSFYINPTNFSRSIVGFKDKLNNVYDYINEAAAIKIYTLNELIYSVLVTADSLATAQYSSDTKFVFRDFDIDSAVKVYRNGEIYKGIKEHEATGLFEGSINSIRCNIFKETNVNLTHNIDENIFLLEGPTGVGKTNMALNLILQSIYITQNTNNPITKAIYTAPFNSITSQTAEDIEEIMDGSGVNIALVNSSTPIKTFEDDNGEVEYDLSLLDYQTLNYNMVFTSHVKLFSVLFGTARSDKLALVGLLNSVVVIDELQAYNPVVWARMVRLMDIYAKYFNIKFILMSATLPKIQGLLGDSEESSYIDLVKDSRVYFKNDFFKERIKKYNFYLLKDTPPDKRKEKEKYNAYRDELFSTLIEQIRNKYKNGNSKVLVEFLTKESCYKFFNAICEANTLNAISDGLDIRMLTSDDNEYSSKETIAAAKNKDNILIVATQCIEAGVNIDMHHGFKDVSYVENEEQFIGRINRNCRYSTSSVTFFNLDNADAIYTTNGVNYKAPFNILSPKYREAFLNKEFNSMFKDVIEFINIRINSNNIKTTIQTFKDNVLWLNYSGIEKDLELIESKEEYLICLPFNLEIKDKNGENVMLSGEESWNEYKNAYIKDDYAKSKIVSMDARINLSCFCYRYSFFGGNEKFEDMLYSKGCEFECINGIYYLKISTEEAVNLLDDNYRLDKEKFDTFTCNLII